MTLAENARTAYHAEKAALQAILALDGHAREQALTQLRARDAELATVVARRIALTAAAPPEASDAPATPPRIARYHLLDEIGHGGMGRVWRARRADAADQQVLAIKQVRAESVDAGLLRRFESERRILARLDHPHIVPLLDAGLDDDGRPFLVTACIDGHSIDRHCRETGLNLRARVALMRDVVGALAHAHRQLIVHRDLKPANILVEANGRVRLLDFGIAKLLDDAPEATAAGTSLMSLRYAAPEQVTGDSLGVGVDLYAVGVLLYELLAGRSPYGELRDPPALLHAIANRDAPAVPGKTPAGETIPRDLAAIVATLLRKRAEQRYVSAEALGEELERWLAGRPVLAMRGQRGYQMQRWLRRRWPWLAAAAILLGLAGFHTWRLDRQLTATARERDKAQAVADYFVTLFRGATPSAARSGEISVRELLDQGTQKLLSADANAQSPAALAALLQAVGRVQRDLGQHAQSADLHQRAVDLLRDEGNADALAEALRGLAAAYYHLDRPRDYLATSQEALAVLEAAGDTSSAAYGRVLGNVGLGHLAQGELDQVWPYLDRSAAVFAAGGDALRNDHVQALTNAGGVATLLGDYPRAHALLVQAEAQALRLQPRNTAQELFITRNLALVARDHGRLREARQRYDDLLDRSVAFLGAGHPDLVAVLIGRAETALADDRLADAITDLDRARHEAAQSLPPEHGQFTDIDGLRALAQVARGEFTAARALLERARARRGDRAIVETQAHLEAVALARTDCASVDGRIALRSALARLRDAQGVPPWQSALAARWARECELATASSAARP